VVSTASRCCGLSWERKDTPRKILQGFDGCYLRGNFLKNDITHTYTWDADGNMLSTDGSTVTMMYDALDRMIEQTRGSSHTEIVYGPYGMKLALMNGASLVNAFVKLPGGSRAVYGSSGLAYYRHADHLGSSRLATTTTRTKYYDVAYAPYGEDYNGSGTTADLSFTDQNQDTVKNGWSSNLYDFMFREYRTAHGRWTSPDPGGLGAVDPTNPQTWNRYAYVGNNPLGLVDPLGLSCEDPHDGQPCIIEVTATVCNVGEMLEDVGGVEVCVPDDIAFFLQNHDACPQADNCINVNGSLNTANNASNAVLNFLASCEGFSGTAYADSRGNCTIGYGHLLHLGGCTAADNALSVTQPAAMNQLSNDVNTAVNALNNNLTVPLNQGQFDAMVSLTFNMGIGRLETHDVWRDVNAGNMAAIPRDIRSLGAGGQGIPARRGNEANMFQNGAYANACYQTP
jgi:RHS repeat-associated protein